ncbi:ATP-binding protein [Salinimicrobium oceani]|uniref:histidine kinase n=1 Tax=Salinimicrobium oceani TaxID=2722702 RepID=A0ABX1CZE1_9FLAO|nr:ATP-binding protein [Salinimicrobium oceani]NJW52487.1 PAS domain S-box protein [Salinimicrobium oceani]
MMLPESSTLSYDLLIDQQFLFTLGKQDLSVQYINFPALVFTGKCPQELKGKFINEVVHSEDLEVFRKLISSLKEGEEKQCILRLRKGNGTWESFNFRCRPYKQGEEEMVLSLAIRTPDKSRPEEDHEKVNFLRNEYEHLLESLDEAFALVDVIYSPEGEAIDFLFLKTNPSYEKQANLKNVVGKTVSEILPGYSRSMLKKIGEVAVTGKPVRFQEKSKSLGEWFDLYAFKVGADKSRQVAFLFRNITEGKASEEKMQEELVRNQDHLRESKELLQTVFDTTNLGIAVLRTIYAEDGSIADFEFARVNKVIREMYLQQDVIGSRYTDVSKYGMEMGIFDAYKKVMETGEPFDEEFFFAQEGYNNWFRVTARSNRDLIITTIEDITKVKLEGEALKDSLKFKKELVETTPEVIMIVDLNSFKVKYINKDLLPQAGITKERVQSLGLAEILPFIHPRDREKMLDLHKKLLKSSNDQIYDIELRLKLSGVTWEWFNVRGKVFLRRDETWVDEYVLLVRNISEQKQTQRALLKAEKLSIQGELARTFAHELRNPLASIGMVGEVMSQKIPEAQKEELKPYFEILKRSTKTLNNLVSNLLNAANYTPAILEKQDLSEILDNTISNASDRIYLSGIKVVKNYGGNYTVMADKEKLQIALLNIIVNASEATTPGEGIIEIDIETRGTEYILSIKDNGHGMEESEIEHLFEAFYSKKENGLGVGLSSVKNILEEHDAQITVSSEPDKGTCFKISFHNAAEI